MNKNFYFLLILMSKYNNCDKKKLKKSFFGSGTIKSCNNNIKNNNLNDIKNNIKNNNLNDIKNNIKNNSFLIIIILISFIYFYYYK